MKILAFTDVHGDKKAINNLIKKSKEAELLVCAGDLTALGHSLENILKLFTNLNKKIIVIHGNHESHEQIKEACRKYGFLVDIHLKKFQIKDIVFFGFGGGGFNEFDIELEKAMKKLNFDKRKIIFVTHGPPYGTKLDKLERLGFRGSESVREFILKFSPKINICGHLHENDGKEDKLNETIIINPGKNGRIIEI